MKTRLGGMCLCQLLGGGRIASAQGLEANRGSFWSSSVSGAFPGCDTIAYKSAQGTKNLFWLMVRGVSSTLMGRHGGSVCGMGAGSSAC